MGPLAGDEKVEIDEEIDKVAIVVDQNAALGGTQVDKSKGRMLQWIVYVLNPAQDDVLMELQRANESINMRKDLSSELSAAMSKRAPGDFNRSDGASSVPLELFKPPPRRSLVDVLTF